jgi:hypothetical protein
MGAWFRVIEDAFASLFRRGPSAAEEFRRQGGVLAFRLLQDARVQNELGLGGRQVGQVQQAVRECRQKRQKDLQALRSRGAESGPELQELMAAVAAEALKALERAAVLTPEQKVRFQQILWQNRGPVAFSDPSLQAALGLTEEQKAAIRAAVAEVWKKAQAGAAPAEGGPARAERMAAHRKEAVGRALAALSEEQRQRWQELLGAPFVVELGPVPPHGAGEGGGPG